MDFFKIFPLIFFFNFFFFFLKNLYHHILDFLTRTASISRGGSCSIRIR